MDGMHDSGIQWIGLTPENWNLLRMKDCSYMKGRIGWQGLTADEFIEEGPYLITGTDFDNGRVCWDRSYHISEKRYDEDHAIQVREGDLLVTKDGTIGKLAYIDSMPGRASLNSHLLLIRPLRGKYINRFLYWVLGSSVFQGYYELVSSGSTMDSISQEKIGNFHFFAPSIIEQEAIADYLDKHCAKLDSIISDLELQIETLQKYRKSLILKTVIHGIDNTSLKESRIEWARDIPENWSTLRMQDIADYKKGPFGSAVTVDMFIEKDDNTFKVYEQKNAINADHELGWYYLSYEDYRGLKDFAVVPGDVIVSCAGTIGKCYILPEGIEPGIINQALMRVRIHEGFSKQYFLYVFDVALEYMNEKYSNGSAIKNIPPFSVLKKQEIPVPPYDEQLKIVQYLDRTCEKLDAIQSMKEQQLKVAKEEKTALIFEYVTGKKRVKEAM